MLVQLSSLFSRRAAALAGAAVVAFGLAGCGQSVEPINPQVFESMHSKPVDSYTLLPVVKRNDEGKLQPTGGFNLVIKLGELRNANAVNPEGQSGEMLCSTYLMTNASLNKMGELTVYYDNGGRYSPGYHYKIEPEGSKLRLPPSYEGSSLYRAYHNQYCTFTPAIGR
jgi:hypothetical protein